MTQPTLEKLRELARRLSLEQKVRLLTGADEWSLHAEPAVGLRRIVLSDGPSGIRGEHWDGRSPVLNLPSATALSASWDTSLAHRYGAILAVEARRMGADVVLGPTINLHRSPLGGRHFEAYSEDPLLTSRMAAAYVRGVQEGGVGATPKHYVGNDAETDRLTVDNRIGERALRELYLAAFEDTVVNERPWMVMSAYNAVNGATMTENGLLAEPLCGEWGFDGVVVSDWWAARTTEPAAKARQDLVMPGPDGPWGDKLVEAVRSGRVPEAAVDEKVVRILRLAARVGALQGWEPAIAAPPQAEDGPAFAREAAAAGFVLVRNQEELPWTATELTSVAVVGHNAFLARTQGGGSATVEPAYTVSPLEGLRSALPGVRIDWQLGAAVQRGIAPFDASEVFHPVSGEPGVRLIARKRDGAVLVDEHRRNPELARLGGPHLAEAADLELSFRYLPARSGQVRIGAATAGELWLLVDGVEVLHQELLHTGEVFGGGLVGAPSASVPVQVIEGTPVDITVRLRPARQPGRDRAITLIVGLDLETATPDEQIAQAVEAARAADVALVVVGTSPDQESESFDRTSLSLPGRQDELVRQIAAVNPRTVVVVNAGAPVLTPWRDEVAAVLLTWFGGQEYGNALADVLLGAAEPGGRLPTTWPAAEQDVPVLSTTPVDGRLVYREGIHVGYRAWLRSGAAPAFPFGYGLGYTTWDLPGADIPATLPVGADLEVAVRVRNVGRRSGKFVVQAYLSRTDSEIDRPVRWLAGFTTGIAAPDETSTPRITVPARAFQHWADGGWHTEPGTYRVHIGFSSVDLPVAATVRIA
ncbi:beta-glucosidase family protein [Nonomuraea angiospora]|uniref:beta-glucosidase family protein n=1 Tax=Nonomuraea angiospora TaxID=46172 RepID=UPI0029BA22DD|nr:glycoside hydrolase family 3 C-terminal domain-containing protein [Nonomuraea angiospora]MDX3100924.1 glycoside hydrolase family 3 C-terminal domain-containing protein [Nonomuraea angiospora]